MKLGNCVWIRCWKRANAKFFSLSMEIHEILFLLFYYRLFFT
jgi:hypothetical protein